MVQHMLLVNELLDHLSIHYTAFLNPSIANYQPLRFSVCRALKPVTCSPQWSQSTEVRMAATWEVCAPSFAPFILPHHPSPAPFPLKVHWRMGNAVYLWQIWVDFFQSPPLELLCLLLQRSKQRPPYRLTSQRSYLHLWRNVNICPLTLKHRVINTCNQRMYSCCTGSFTLCLSHAVTPDFPFPLSLCVSLYPLHHTF